MHIYDVVDEEQDNGPHTQTWKKNSLIIKLIFQQALDADV